MAIICQVCLPRPALSPVIPEIESSLFEVTALKLADESQFKSANYYLKKAIGVYFKKEQWDNMIHCHIKIGNNYQQMDENEKAMEHYNQALELLLKHSGYEYAEIANQFKKLAYFNFLKKEYGKALELYQKALKLYLKIFGENHIQVAKIYNSIALIFWNKGDTRKATENYNRSLSIKLKISSYFRMNLEKKYAFIDGGETNYLRFRQIRDSLEKSLKTYHETYGGIHPLIGTIYEKIGILFGFEGSYDRAMDCFKKSLNIRIESIGDESLDTASSYHNIGICLRLQKDYPEAIRFLEKSLLIKTTLYGEKHRFAADSYYQLGKVYFYMNQFGKSLHFFQKALMAIVPDFSNTHIYCNPEPEKVFVKSELLQVLADKADALRMSYQYDPQQVNDLKISFETYHLVSQLIDMIRRDFKSDDYKLIFSERSHEIYEKAIPVALSLYNITGENIYKEEAFIFSERSKAALLYESVMESNARKFSGIPENMLEKERELKKELAYLGTYLEKESQNVSLINTKKVDQLENKYFNKQEEYQQLTRFFEYNYKRYYHLKYQYLPTSIQDFQKAMNLDSALIEYFFSNETLVIFVLTKEDFHFTLHSVDSDFIAMVESYYRSIKKIEDRSFLFLSQSLYRILIEPVHKWISDKKTLIIVPHGDLYYIPFESLIPGPEQQMETDFSNCDFLIKHYAISYHYSASLWYFRDLNGSEKKGKSFIGFAPVFSEKKKDGYILSSDTGEPDFVSPTPDSRSLSYDGKQYSQLLETESEVFSIVEMFRKSQLKAMGYFHNQATEGHFKQCGIKKYDYIHIATHSISDQRNPKLAGLLFSQNSENSDEDGILYSEETFNLDLDAELIILSSCESGVGKLIKGEGMMALNRGFFYSGARNIIFSLWKVEDKATCKLMVEFYRNVLKGSPISTALKNAKLALIREKFTAFPKYWSGFILLGN